MKAIRTAAVGAIVLGIAATLGALTIPVTFPKKAKAKIQAIVDETGNVLFGSANPGKVQVTNPPVAPLAPGAASNLVTIQAPNSVGTVCTARSSNAIVFDRKVNPQGGGVSTFTIPPERVFVATAFDWILFGSSATSQVRTALVFSVNGGVNGPTATSSALADSGGRAGGSVVFPNGIVIKPPGTFCMEMSVPASGDNFIGVVHGFLAPDA